MKSRGAAGPVIRPERGTLPLALFGALPGIDVPPRLAIVDRHVDRALGQRSRPASRRTGRSDRNHRGACDDECCSSPRFGN
jgi:hypothetical protein